MKNYVLTVVNNAGSNLVQKLFIWNIRNCNHFPCNKGDK